MPLLLPPRPRSQREKRRGCYPSTLCRSLQLVPDGLNDPGVDALTCGGCCRSDLGLAWVGADPQLDRDFLVVLALPFEGGFSLGVAGLQFLVLQWLHLLLRLIISHRRV
nr:MAG TPA: hypothetical protein [Bacteriophage sp.]